VADLARDYELLYLPAAGRDIKKLKNNRQLLERIDKAIGQLASDPRPDGVEILEGSTSYRLRVGSYRILYDVDDDARSVVIARVRDRKEVYKY
jgi:mRNA interferase RelE/StbE